MPNSAAGLIGEAQAHKGNTKTLCRELFGLPWFRLSDEQRRLARRVFRTKSYYKNHDAHKTAQRNLKRDIKIKVLAAIGKAARCERCGYDRCSAAIEFHHRDPSAKLFGVLTGARSMRDRIAEAAKCDLLCSNCHREAHASGEIVAVSGRKRAYDVAVASSAVRFG